MHRQRVRRLKTAIPKGGGVSPDHVTVTAAEYNAVAIEQDWAMPRQNDYEGPLCHLMAHVHGHEFPRYPKDTLFTKVQLLELHSQHIQNWLALKGI